MNLWHFLTSQFSSNNFLNAAVIGGTLAGIALSLKKIPKIIWDYFLGKIMTSITVDSHNELFYWLNSVVQEMPFHKHRYSFYIFGKNRRYSEGENEEKPVAVFPDENSPDNRKKFLEYVYSPDEGRYFFYHQHHWFFISFERETHNSGMPLFTLKIKYFGRSKKFFDEIMAEAEERYKKFHKEQLVLVINDAWGGWVPSHTTLLHSKPMESVILPKGTMQKIVDDVQLFKNSEKKYLELGIPYHRTYLFYGIPGTGKTSTIYALANYFKMTLFYLNLQILPDDRLHEAFNSIRPDSILVIEDLGNIYNKENFAQKRSNDRPSPPSYNLFINCLDGFLSKHGALTILTTNHFERLGESMLRPGRIDTKIKFGYCDEYQIYQMCQRYFELFGSTKEEADKKAVVLKDTLAKANITPAFLQKVLMDMPSDMKFEEYVNQIKNNLGENNERVF